MFVSNAPQMWENRFEACRGSRFARRHASRFNSPLEIAANAVIIRRRKHALGRQPADSMTVHLIAIVGGSGSGKTWLARRLKRRLGRDAEMISLDDFYRDLSALPRTKRDRRNFDDPAAIEWPLFIKTLARIQRGEPAAIPRYDFATHTRRAQPRRWKPKPIVLLDGLWLLREARARRLYSLSIYVDALAEVRLRRRVARDQQERGRSRASVLRQFREHVEPMHRQFVAPQRRCADIVLSAPLDDEILGRLAATAKRLVANPKVNR